MLKFFFKSVSLEYLLISSKGVFKKKMVALFLTDFFPKLSFLQQILQLFYTAILTKAKK